MSILVEVCVDSLQGAVVAAEAGADRLELNVALELDGLTPSWGLVQQVLEDVSIPVIAMCRPRSGNFVYSVFEWRTMIADAARLVEQGVAGIAFGCLNSDGRIEYRRVDEMRKRFSQISLVFHKAIDELSDPISAATELADLGIQRLMTSGGCADSLLGADRIRDLVRTMGGQIEVIPAGGVSSANALDIVRRTGVDQLHGSFSGGNPRAYASIGTEIRRTVEVLADRQKTN